MFQFPVGSFATGQSLSGDMWVATTLPVGSFATGQAPDESIDDWSDAELTSYA